MPVDPSDRGWRPEIHLYVAKHGDEDGRQGQLAFHTLSDAERWLSQSVGSRTDPADVSLSKVDASSWTWDDGGWGDGGMGFWAEVQKVRVSQPERLLRDERQLPEQED